LEGKWSKINLRQLAQGVLQAANNISAGRERSLTNKELGNVLMSIGNALFSISGDLERLKEQAGKS
jgi:cob(I)alamin adenosyltransferase